MFEFIHSKNQKEYAYKLIKKYMVIDEKNKTIQVTLKYEKASDLISKDVNDAPFLKEEVYEKITKIITEIPGRYKYNFIIVIDDFENFTSKDLMEIIEDYFGIKYFEKKKSLRRKRYAAFSLLIAGTLFLILSILASSLKWLGNETSRTIVNEILDIVAWVFIWEAATIYYLEGFTLKAKQKIIKNKINSITIENSNNKNLTEYNDKIFHDEKDILDTINTIKDKIEDKQENKDKE